MKTWKITDTSFKCWAKSWKNHCSKVCFYYCCRLEAKSLTKVKLSHRYFWMIFPKFMVFIETIFGVLRTSRPIFQNSLEWLLLEKSVQLYIESRGNVYRFLQITGCCYDPEICVISLKTILKQSFLLGIRLYFALIYPFWKGILA